MASDACKTGRFIVTDFATGRRFMVEPIGPHRTGFGSSLEEWCDGSTRERDSMITAERGFTDIRYSNSPMDEIARMLRS